MEITHVYHKEFQFYRQRWSDIFVIKNIFVINLRVVIAAVVAAADADIAGGGAGSGKRACWLRDTNNIIVVVDRQVYDILNFPAR